MPLDPAVEALLAELQPTGSPRGWQLPLDQRRSGMRERFLRLGGEPAHLDSIRDLVLGGVPTRLYCPPAASPLLPVLVFFHGGGWALGGLDTHHALCSQLAAHSGWAVVSVGYRLAPEHKFPIPVFDCWNALRAANAAAKQLGLHGDRMAVGGDSAGGNLAAVMALLARDYELPLAAQVLLYPVIDARCDRPSYSFDYLLCKPDMVSFWDYYLHHREEAKSPLASPIEASSLQGLPPALVVTAEYDPLRDEGEEYAERLEQAGVRVKLSRYEGMIHGFASMPVALPQAQKVYQEIREFLQEACG